MADEVLLNALLGSQNGSVVKSSCPRSRPGILLDRDGTIIVDQGYVGSVDLDLTTSWVVGDRPEDIGLAEAVGASASYLGSGACDRPGIWSFPSLAAPAPFILERIVV